MPTSSSILELSVIVPILNEAGTLPSLLQMLAAQRQIAFELILSDGGSNDASLTMVRKLVGELPYPLQLLQGPRGRARQLNFGARAARAPSLLFLHVDSAWDDPLALRCAVDHLRGHTQPVAGHFPLRFDLGTPSCAYLYYSCKAQLGRPGSIHGDQGMLLSSSFFDELGGFEESRSVLEDTFFAEHLRERGKWILLDAPLTTSARRFAEEGLLPRQLLNALIMNFAHIGWDDFFVHAAGVYRPQHESGQLKLSPFFELIASLLAQMPKARQRQLWHETGRYVVGQGWQLALWWDVRRLWRRGSQPETLETTTLDWFEAYLTPLLVRPTMVRMTEALVRLWFALSRRWLRWRRG